MSMIKITNLTFAYEGSYDNIFENVSFTIDTDWKLGFVGRNGRGKTTFLNLLLGKYEYEGKIETNVKFAYFPYEVKDLNLDTLTILKEISKNTYDWELIREIAYLNVKEEVLYRPFKTLSNGERTKVLLAALFLNDEKYLLIDEPTNHLDLEGRKVVADYLKKKKSFILVSHDRSFIDEVVDHILAINKTNITVESGNFSSYFINFKRQEQFEITNNERLKKDIKNLQEAAKRTSSWSDKREASKIGNGPCDRGYIGHKAAKLMKRAKSYEDRMTKSIENKQKLLKNVEEEEELKINPLAYPKDILINLEKVIPYYEQNITKPVTFTINKGDRIVLTGQNGAGKSTFIKLISGYNDISYHGLINKGSNLKISYVSQDTSFLKGSLNDFINDNYLDETLFKTILRKMDFKRDQFQKDMGNYSYGQKKKVLIAKSLCEKAHLYVWDEPLNYLDIYTRIQLEDLILNYQPTLVLVEHDKTFIDKIATKIIKIEKA